MKEQPRVMVVDDAIESLMVIEAILEDDYLLELFSDGCEALEYVFSNPPDLILLDVMMPEIDGYEFCRRLKAIPEYFDVPVIFITSKSDVQDEELGFSAGASDFIHKPISAPVLTARVRTHTRLKYLQDCLKNMPAVRAAI